MDTVVSFFHMQWGQVFFLVKDATKHAKGCSLITSTGSLLEKKLSIPFQTPAFRNFQNLFYYKNFPYKINAI
jgi:hypothetical protein